MRTFLAVFFILGLLIVTVPTCSFLKSPSVNKQRLERAALAAWPSVIGTLDEVRFQKEHHRTRGVTWYYVEVRYHYIVDGSLYKGLCFGIDQIRDTSKDTLKSRISSRFVSRENIITEEEGVKGYEEPGIDLDHGEPRTVWRLRDQTVPVYYDPKKPESSLLDTHDYNPPSLLKELAPLMALIPIGMLIMAVSAWKWQDLNRGRAELAAGSKKIVAPDLEKCFKGGHWYNCHKIAETLLKGRRFSDALAAFDRSLSLNPWEAGTVYSGIESLLGKAECLIELGRREEAQRCLDQVILSSRGMSSAAELRTRAEELKRSSPVIMPVDNWFVISPFATRAEQSSPDGMLTASVLGLQEIGMGGPTSGTLEISNGISVKNCNPSLLWSSDSRYLAVPQWTQTMKQRLLIIYMADRSIHTAPGTYRILRLESFENGVVRGIDSPEYQPQPFEVRVDKVLA
jgi:tetratricopeptide (TPR) repeat protein